MKIFKRLFLLALIFVFWPTSWFSRLPHQDWFENGQLFLALLVAFLIAKIIFDKLGKWRRRPRFLAFLIQFLLFFLLVMKFPPEGELPEVMTTAWGLVTFIILFQFVIPIINLFWWLVKKISRLLTVPKFRFVFVRLSLLTLLIFAGYRYFYLEKRVAKLEEIAGRKKVACDEKKAVEEAKKTLVRIIGSAAEGTGFFISNSGFIITNHHVIASDPNPKIVFPDYAIAQGEVIMADKSADVAFIKIYGRENLPVLGFADSDQIEPLEELISLGFPYGTELKGDPTIIKGHFVAKRRVKEMGVNLVQTDMSLNPGASGGPMINACGEVVAMNVSGTAGLGMGIASNDLKLKQWEVAVSQEPLKDVKKVALEPNASPQDCVRAFFTYQTIGKLEEAYRLLTPDYTGNTPFDQWRQGYQNTLNILIYKIEDKGKETVFVKFSSADLEGEEVVYKFFEGTFGVQNVDGQLRLATHEVFEILPDWEWFYE